MTSDFSSRSNSNDWDGDLATLGLSKLMDGDLSDTELHEFTGGIHDNADVSCWTENMLVSHTINNAGPPLSTFNAETMTFVSTEGSSSNGSENGSTYESSSSISSATSSGGTEQQQQQQVPKKAAVSQAPRLFGRAVSLPLCPAPLPARGGGIAGQASSASKATAGQKPMAANAPNRATVPMHVVGHVHSPLGQANSGYASSGNPAPIAPRRVPPAQAASSPPKTPIMPAPPTTGATSNTNIPILPNNSANLTKPPPPVTLSSSSFTASSALQLSLAIASTANTKQDLASLTTSPASTSKQNPTKGPAPRAKYKKRKTKDTDTTTTISTPTTKGYHPDQAQRDRNKEHAKNTRLRKKAYIDTLKATLMEMVEQRDATLQEVSLEAQRNDQHRQVRWQVLQTFLGMRGRGSDSYSQDEHAGWSALLEDAFTLTRPGGFQKSAAGTHVETERVVLEGIVPAMSDPNEATRLIRECSIGKSSSACVEFTYSCDQSTMLMDGCTCVIHWSGGTHDARSKSGIPTEITMNGTLRALFNEKTNKLLSVTLFFDTGAIRRQLRGS